ALTRPSSSSDTTARLALISRTAATVTTPARKMRPTADRTILARDGGSALGPLAPVAGESTGGDVRPLAIDTPYRGGPRSSRSSQSASIATGAADGRGLNFTSSLYALRHRGGNGRSGVLRAGGGWRLAAGP